MGGVRQGCSLTHFSPFSRTLTGKTPGPHLPQHIVGPARRRRLCPPEAHLCRATFTKLGGHSATPEPQSSLRNPWRSVPRPLFNLRGPLHLHPAPATATSCVPLFLVPGTLFPNCEMLASCVYKAPICGVRGPDSETSEPGLACGLYSWPAGDSPQSQVGLHLCLGGGRVCASPFLTIKGF
jgi:hypothetical protein